MLTFDVISLFPNLIQAHLGELPFKKALENRALCINTHQLRDYSNNKHNTVDDKPYGGGTGMLLKVEPIYLALKQIYEGVEAGKEPKKAQILVTMPQGELLDQKMAAELATYDQLSIVCGRYEGIDHRVLHLNEVLNAELETQGEIAIKPVSIGKYVLSGGELPALVIMESITRLLEGVLEKPEATEIESFSKSLDYKEFPQYTRPEDFKGLKVPETLLSGHHAQIEAWRENKNDLL